MGRLALDHPLPDELLPDPLPEAIGEIVLTDAHLSYARIRWPEESVKQQRYRVKRSIWAKCQALRPHPDDPNRRAFGGAQPGAGPKRKAIGRAIVEHFEERTKEVLDAIAAPLSKTSGATPMERHRAGMNIAEHARREEKEKREADEYTRLTDDEARTEYAKVLAEAIRSGQVSLDDITNIIDGHAEEIIDEAQQIAS